jgi:predicted MFS family arabinose efflux permease
MMVGKIMINVTMKAVVVMVFAILVVKMAEGRNAKKILLNMFVNEIIIAAMAMSFVEMLQWRIVVGKNDGS